MDWPTPQDYNEAIQNPQNCFSDPELKQGAPLLTKLGLPKPITGAFASVYKVNCRTRSWAVRCFLREFADQERRYSAISDKLRAAKLGCTADFDFLARGILIRGRWYPVLKMEWIDGEPISEYIRRNLAQRQVLQSLSRQWIALMASLRKAQIAHGDLQHGNILVSGSVLKLVDYDGMYVPALAGMDSHEVGHPNYQRPGRTERDYHPDLDSFSAWVIFTSISALAIDPRLWNLLDAGDECLLFRRADFEKPRASRALQTLEKSRDLRLQTLASQFRSILCLPIAQIPSLDGSCLERQSEIEPKHGRNQQSEAGELPDWLSDHINERGPQSDLPPLDDGVTEAPIIGASWLYDHLVDESSPAQPEPPVIRRLDRIAVWLFPGILGIMVQAWALSFVSVLVFALVVCPTVVACASILAVGYKGTNRAGKRSAIQDCLMAGRTRLAQIEGIINLSHLERARLGELLPTIKTAYDKLHQLMAADAEKLDKALATTLAQIQARRRQLQKEHQEAMRLMDREVEALDKALATTLAQIEARRRQAQQEHQEAMRLMDCEVEALDKALATTLKRIEGRGRQAQKDEESAITRLEGLTHGVVSQLLQKRDSLKSQEGAEINRALQQLRSLHRGRTLRWARVTASAVSGIGPALTERLHAAGVSSASDVSYNQVRNVPGIGATKAHALVAWRRRLEQEADSTAPSSLSQAESTRIRAKYASLDQTIGQQIASSKDKERKERQQILQRFAASRKTLDIEEESARRDFNDRRAKLEAKNRRERDRIDAQAGSLRQTLDTEEEDARRDFNDQRAKLEAKNGKERNRVNADSQSVRRTLDAEEESATRDHEGQRGAAKAKFEKEKQRLRADYEVEKVKVLEARKKLDEKVDEMRRSLHQKRLEVRRGERELEKLKDITPKTYLRLLLLPKRIT